jgi:hypothetical protein
MKVALHKEECDRIKEEWSGGEKKDYLNVTPRKRVVYDVMTTSKIRRLKTETSDIENLKRMMEEARKVSDAATSIM